MADYDWTKPCGCPLMYHRDTCKEHPDFVYYEEARRVRPLGFVMLKKGLYGCRRGCGCVVWNVDDHIKNVCKEFNPIAGETTHE